MESDKSTIIDNERYLSFDSVSRSMVEKLVPYYAVLNSCTKIVKHVSDAIEIVNPYSSLDLDFDVQRSPLFKDLLKNREEAINVINNMTSLIDAVVPGMKGNNIVGEAQVLSQTVDMDDVVTVEVGDKSYSKNSPITSINDERLQERVNEAIAEWFGDVVNNSETEG